MRAFEKSRRLHYNLIAVSDDVLNAVVTKTLDGTELPKWAEIELYAPIPVDADRSRVAEAKARAREGLYYNEEKTEELRGRADEGSERASRVSGEAVSSGCSMFVKPVHGGTGGSGSVSAQRGRQRGSWRSYE